MQSRHLLFVLAVGVAPVLSSANNTNRLHEVVVTGTRLPTEQVPVEKMPANVSVLDTQTVASSPSFTMPDLLRQQVGIMPFDTVGFGQFGNISMRGFGEKAGTLFLVDGVRVNDAGSSDMPFLWNTVPLENIERIEVIRGGASTTYGEGALGGVINIITKRPADKPVSVKLIGAGGNLGYYAGHVDVSGRLSAFDYVVSGDRQEWSGWRDASDFRSWTAMVKPGFDTPLGRFMFGYYFHEEISLNPGPLTAAQLQANPRQAGTTIFVYTNTVQRGTLDYQKKFDSGWTILGNLHGQVYDTKLRGYGGMHIEQPNYGTTWQASYHGDFCHRPNVLTFGVEAVQQDFRSLLSSIYGTSTTVADNWTVSVFAQDSWTLTPKLTLTSGVRYDHRQWHIEALSDPAYTPDIRTRREADVWSPKIGLTYEFVERTSGWLSLSRSYRLPSGFDIGTPSFVTGALSYPNAEVDPVIANTVEVGIRCQRVPWLGGSLAYFYSHVTDDIVYNPWAVYDSGWGSYFGENQNFDSNRQGVELTLTSMPASWVDFYFSTAYTDSRFDGGPFDGKRLPQVPEWQLTGGANVRPIKGLQLTLECVHVRDQIASNDLYNRFTGNQYFLCNAKVRYTWRQFTAFAAVNNLFDRRTETFPTVQTDWSGAQTRMYNPAAGINFQAGATVAF